MPYPRDTHYNLSAEQRAELASSQRKVDSDMKVLRRKTTIIGPIGDAAIDAEDKQAGASLGRRLTGQAAEAEKGTAPPLSELAACVSGDVFSGYLAGASVAPILCIIDKVSRRLPTCYAMP
jgi:hypothetical protein